MKFGENIFFFVLETPMYKMTCIKCVHFNPMMAYGWFQLCLFLEISANLKCDHANQKCQMKIGKICLVTLMPTSKKKNCAIFSGTYFVHDDPPYCSLLLLVNPQINTAAHLHTVHYCS